jgi:hypothetical protein
MLKELFHLWPFPDPVSAPTCICHPYPFIGPALACLHLALLCINLDPALALSWLSSIIALTLVHLWPCLVSSSTCTCRALSLLWPYFVLTLVLLWPCLSLGSALALSLPWFIHGPAITLSRNALFLPWLFHVSSLTIY